MQHTLMVTGTAKTVPVQVSEITTGFKVQYDIIIWAARRGEPLQLINFDQLLLCGHGDLWAHAKRVASEYFAEPQFGDGAYTQYLEHLITV